MYFINFCNLSIISCLDVFSALATASSANRFMCSSRDISLMNTRNRSDPSIDHWGTPDLIFNGSDFVPFISTNCSLLLR